VASGEKWVVGSSSAVSCENKRVWNEDPGVGPTPGAPATKLSEVASDESERGRSDAAPLQGGRCRLRHDWSRALAKIGAGL